jgi:hypothetical protein
MAELESFGELSKCAELSIGLLYDELKCRPIMQVAQSFGRGPRCTLRYAISPTVSVPSWLIQDVTATFLQALVDLLRHQFGIQEELELSRSPGSSTESGEVSTEP